MNIFKLFLASLFAYAGILAKPLCPPRPGREWADSAADDAIEAGRRFLEAWRTRDDGPIQPSESWPKPPPRWSCFRCGKVYDHEPVIGYVTVEAGRSACPACWKTPLADLDQMRKPPPVEKAERPDPPPTAPGWQSAAERGKR